MNVMKNAMWMTILCERCFQQRRVPLRYIKLPEKNPEAPIQWIMGQPLCGPCLIEVKAFLEIGRLLPQVVL